MATLTKFSGAILLIACATSVCAADSDQDNRLLIVEEIQLEKSLELWPRTLGGPIDYPNHFLACRANEPDKVADIIAAVGQTDTDVLLYFHGGLSPQKYVVEKLGPWLMKSVFEQAAVKRKLYPIFVNYDAGVWDWDIFSIEAKSILDSLSYRNLRARIRDRLGLSDKQGSSANERAVAAGTAARLLYTFDREKSLKRFDQSSEEERVQYFLDLLKANELPEQFRDNSKNVQSELDLLAKSFQDVDNEYAQKTKLKPFSGAIELKSGLGKRVLDAPAAALRILRILARMALENDHGLDAAVAEEVFDALHVSDLGQLHWDKVRRHAKECFAEASNGSNLIDQLDELLEAKGRKLHTWSHSAGSIPTAELIRYLGQRTTTNRHPLDQVQMVAPAISLDEFNNLVLKHTNVFSYLKVYALAQEFERNDELLLGLYPASLLYAVSSLADKTFYLDKMLILDQHMQPKRKPYKFPLYRTLTGERPLDTWQFLSGNPATNAGLYIYPRDADSDHVKCERGNKKCGPSHEGTKLPWLSTDLSRHVLERLNVEKAKDLIFDDPSR